MSDDGGPAFPAQLSNSGPQEGMSLRDYFAAKAMVGLLTQRVTLKEGEADNRDSYTGAEPVYRGHFISAGDRDDGADLADDAYRIADAMLAERAKP